MAQYVTQQQMVDRYGEQELIDLTDRSSTGAIDATVLGDAISDASDLIDTYIGGRYELPLQYVPTILVRTCGEIARWMLYTVQAPEEVANRYNACIKWLTQVSTGVVRLGIDPSQVAPTPADGASIQSDGLVFGRKDNSFL